MHPTHVKLHVNSNEIKKWFPDSLAFRSLYQCLADDFFFLVPSDTECHLLRTAEPAMAKARTLVAMVWATFGYCG